ncbi:MAG: hypothetical protein RML84_09170 [Anaerolineae bacterium]|nr:hypothetical protein [Anaerolineae bacterium]
MNEIIQQLEAIEARLREKAAEFRAAFDEDAQRVDELVKGNIVSIAASLLNQARETLKGVS